MGQQLRERTHVRAQRGAMPSHAERIVPTEGQAGGGQVGEMPATPNATHLRSVAGSRTSYLSCLPARGSCRRTASSCDRVRRV
jgi:hypothetical protein